MKPYKLTYSGHQLGIFWTRHIYYKILHLHINPRVYGDYNFNDEGLDISMDITSNTTYITITLAYEEPT